MKRSRSKQRSKEDKRSGLAPLRILDWSGASREVRFVSWNTAHSVCFIYDEQHVRRAINLSLPSLFNLRFHENPFPNSPPEEILRTALHLPPCLASKKEADALRTKGTGENAVASQFFPWQLVTRHVMHLEPKDDKALTRLLRKALARRRSEHKAREREIAALPPEQAEAECRILKGEFSAKGPDGSLISEFDVTLDMVKQGWGGLRDRLLHDEWARLVGLNLDRVVEDARAFRRWIEKRGAIVRENSDVSPGLVFETEWEVLEAAVRYEIRFIDGTRCWLDAIEERPLADAAEVADFDLVEKAQAIPGPLPWHSEGFGTIWRRDVEGEVSDSLPLSNEFRALCQLLAERGDQTAQFSEIEPQIGTRTHELDTNAGQGAKASPTGERRVRDMLRTETGKRLLEWGVLTEIEVGREKFLKLSPPKSAQ